MRPDPRARELRLAPLTGLTSLGPGASVIDMGQATQTVANSLRPCGMVYDLVENQHIPVDWPINPSKAVFGVDFSADGKSNSGGSFIIEPQYASAAASTVAKWQALGVVVNQISTSFVAPINNDNPATPADPEMQFTTRIDAATKNGSEQVYVPSPWCYGWLRPESVSNSDRRLRFPVSRLAHYQGFHNVYPLAGLAAQRA